jgi:hypothetical protein
VAMMRCSQCGHDLSPDATTCSGCGRPLNGEAPPSGKLSPELLECARQQFSEEEFLAGLREIRETGGLELKDFIQELEQEAAPRD